MNVRSYGFLKSLRWEWMFERNNSQTWNISLAIFGLKYQTPSSSVVLYLCLHTSTTWLANGWQAPGTIFHMSFKINTHESWPLHETNEAADLLDSVMTWILLSAAERHHHDRRHSSTQAPHLTSICQHKDLCCTTMCKSDSQIHYPSGLAFIAHIYKEKNKSRDTLSHNVSS